MNFIKTSLLTLFHPIIAFEYIKSDRDKFNYFGPFILVVLIVLTKTLSLYSTHFPMTTVPLRYADIFYECLAFFAPILSWVLASYAITTIIDGESLFREALSAVLYSLVPYIIFTVLLTLFSHVAEYEQAGLFAFVRTVMWIWILLLFFINIKVMNHYTIKQTIFIILISLFTMAILWATFALFISISAQFVTFVKEVAIEIKLLTE